MPTEASSAHLCAPVTELPPTFCVDTSCNPNREQLPLEKIQTKSELTCFRLPCPTIRAVRISIYCSFGRASVVASAVRDGHTCDFSRPQLRNKELLRTGQVRRVLLSSHTATSTVLQTNSFHFDLRSSSGTHCHFCTSLIIMSGHGVFWYGGSRRNAKLNERFNRQF